MRNKICVLLVCLLFVSVLGSCACTPYTFDMPWVYDKEASGTDSPKHTEKPMETLTPLPTPDQTAVPTEAPAKPLPVDPAKMMWYTGEDKDYIKSCGLLKNIRWMISDC